MASATFGRGAMERTAALGRRARRRGSAPGSLGPGLDQTYYLVRALRHDVVPRVPHPRELGAPAAAGEGALRVDEGPLGKLRHVGRFRADHQHRYAAGSERRDRGAQLGVLRSVWRRRTAEPTRLIADQPLRMLPSRELPAPGPAERRAA